MKKYEVMYILKPTLEDGAKEEIIETLHSILISDGGVIENVDNWGLRDFAYEIDGMTKGHYVVTTFSSNPAEITEFERVARINSNVVRTMMLSLEDVKK